MHTLRLETIIENWNPLKIGGKSFLFYFKIFFGSQDI